MIKLRAFLFFSAAYTATCRVFRAKTLPNLAEITKLLKDPHTRLEEEGNLSDSDIEQMAAVDPSIQGLQQHMAFKNAANSTFNTTRMPRQVYIDLGANWGNTMRLYEDIEDAALVGKMPWEIYSFEASPFIQPYLERFTAFLNGLSPAPVITVPPSGSSVHLNLHAPRYGCPHASPGAAWNHPKFEEMRACMFRIFRGQLNNLHADPKLDDMSLIAARLAVADKPPHVGAARFTSVPAAAGAADGRLDLGAMTPEQMIRGGASSQTIPGLPTWSVPVVNVVSWLVSHFTSEDYVVVKMDIEGAEFSILSALLDGGHGCLIDVLAIECHNSVGDCAQLMSKLAMYPCIKILKEGEHGYHGWDHHSGPDKYFAADPRR